MTIDLRTAQRLWTAAGWYSKAIDGLWGGGSQMALDRAEAAGDYQFDPTKAPRDRRIVAAAQAALAKLGQKPGPIDGYAGHHTTDAAEAYLGKAKPAPRLSKKLVALTAIPHQRDVGTYYGRPGPEIEAQLVTLRFPFAFRIDWNLAQTTSKIRVHRKCAPQLERALIAVHKHYGEAKWRGLGLDRYAGAYNHRKMRGGSKWSMHAYGCAIDFFAAPNGLRMRCPQALFCGAEYKPFLDIMQDNEWLPAIRLWGADAMHLQRARI